MPAKKIVHTGFKTTKMNARRADMAVKTTAPSFEISLNTMPTYMVVGEIQ